MFGAYCAYYEIDNRIFIYFSIAKNHSDIEQRLSAALCEDDIYYKSHIVKSFLITNDIDFFVANYEHLLNKLFMEWKKC